MGQNNNPVIYIRPGKNYSHRTMSYELILNEMKTIYYDFID